MANELSQRAIKLAWDTGHFWSFPNDVTQDKLHLLTPDDPVVVKAMISMAKANATAYTTAVLDEHGRLPQFDGVIGPAMLRLINTQRCMVPDYAPPAGVSFTFEDPHLQQVCERMQIQQAIGSGGNWAGCHGIGDFHCAAMQVNSAGMNLRVIPVWRQVMLNCRAAYAGIGLLWKFIGMDGVDLLTGERFNGNIQTELSFVSQSSGWIGLAIVTRNEKCNSKIWLKLLNSYTGGNTDAQITNQITTLLMHEGGHNTGLQHTNGGVMNPSLVNGLPVGVWPDSDPSTSTLRKLYGGVPVPIPGGGNTPLPPDTPKTIEDRLHAQEVINAVQSATIDWLVAKERARGN